MGGGEAGRGERQEITKRHKENFGTDIFTLLIVVMVSWAYMYVRSYQTIYFKVLCF